ncbi:MBL fold metallo-hydrolase [Chelatococcus reniformis]|uniref:MBL fold metallo-hydrolase n=1 Tax=Chelatococcus reniformis TaxID=1494448 RepID=A0A916XLG8_9HYPH|nr:MBL fold metallo-hydrolase [Chelatococcus reniformis]GGC81145.1 MBL fold metallo-hydrolase [Chelatococcus reniformis]
MDAFICTTCGTQYAPAEAEPAQCVICHDERQFVLPSGQAWTTLRKLRRSHMTAFRQEGEFIGIGAVPQVGIGQRALLVRTPAGNVLWDCIALIDSSTIELIDGLGGLAAIAISHPHYYTAMVEWSRAFGDVPVYLNAADREWVMRPDPCISFWEGDAREVLPGLTLLRAGGHFEGGAVLHVAEAAGGRGAILSGDVLQVVPDGRHVAFMRSYPNFIPLGAASVRSLAARIGAWSYDAIYGAWWDRVIPAEAEAAMARSVARHIHWLGRDDI